MRECIAKANVLRCVGCFAFPLLALAAYGYKITSGGYNLQSFLGRIAAGGVPLLSALLVSGGCIAWVMVTWPKAGIALRHAGCSISLDDRKLSLYTDEVERSDIAAVDTIRRPFDWQLRVLRRDGSTIERSVVLLSPSPEMIVNRLQAAICSHDG